MIERLLQLLLVQHSITHCFKFHSFNLLTSARITAQAVLLPRAMDSNERIALVFINELYVSLKE